MTRPPADQAVRDRVVRDFDTTFLLEAGAGTGKTTVLVSRILALVRTGRATLDRIVAITFTEKAAGELKLRLREGIEDALERTQQEDERQRLLAAATDLERAPVSTIHAFAAALLRERPFEAGLDPASRSPPRSRASASSTTRGTPGSTRAWPPPTPRCSAPSPWA
jgi:ATP-dependent helicase/nuclease subunit A